MRMRLEGILLSWVLRDHFSAIHTETQTMSEATQTFEHISSDEGVLFTLATWLGRQIWCGFFWEYFEIGVNFKVVAVNIDASLLNMAPIRNARAIFIHFAVILFWVTVRNMGTVRPETGTRSSSTSRSNTLSLIAYGLWVMGNLTFIETHWRTE